MVDDPVDPGLVEFSSELVLFDLSFLSLEEEELDELEFTLELGEEELGFVVSEGVLAPGVDDVLPGDDVLGDDVLGDEVPAPGVPGEVVCAIRTPPPRKAPSAGTSKTASCFFILFGSFARALDLCLRAALVQPLRQCETTRFQRCQSGQYCRNSHKNGLFTR